MPALEQTDRLQKAVLWKCKGVDRQNNPIIDSPSEINVRWVGSSSRVMDAHGNSIGVDATAVLGNVDIPMGSIMWLGELADWTGTSLPTGLMIVKAVNNTSDIKNRNVRRTVGLMRYNDTLPTVVP